MVIGVLALCLVLTVVAATVIVLRARRAESHYRSVLDQLPSSTATVFDRYLRISSILGSGARSGERPPAAGSGLEDLYPPPEAAMLRDHFRAVLAGESRA